MQYCKSDNPSTLKHVIKPELVVASKKKHWSDVTIPEQVGRGHGKYTSGTHVTWKTGKVTSVVLKSNSNQTIQLKNGQNLQSITLKKGRTKEIRY